MYPIRFGEAIKVQFQQVPLMKAKNENSGKTVSLFPHTEGARYAKNQLLKCIESKGIDAEFHSFYDPSGSDMRYFLLFGDTLSRVKDIEKELESKECDGYTKDKLLISQVANENLINNTQDALTIQYTQSNVTGGTYLRNTKELLSKILKKS